MAEPGVLKRTFRRLTSSNEELESAELQRQVAQSGACAVGNCRDRTRVVLHGTISTLMVQPVDGTKWLEAELKDGSGVVSLIWMGRRSMPGIQAGTVLEAEGRVAVRDGRRVIFNPRYELLSVPQ